MDAKGVTCVFVCEGQKEQQKGPGGLANDRSTHCCSSRSDHEEGVCIVKSSVSRTESGKGAQSSGPSACAQESRQRRCYMMRENSGASGEAYTLPDMSVRLDHRAEQEG